MSSTSQIPIEIPQLQPWTFNPALYRFSP